MNIALESSKTHLLEVLKERQLENGIFQKELQKGYSAGFSDGCDAIISELQKQSEETAEVSFENESRKVVVRQMLETLEKFLTSETIVNPNVIASINHDIDYVTVNYLRHEPDGETQANLWVNVKMSDIGAIHLLSTRICNTLQTI